jgi:hypothetical protein
MQQFQYLNRWEFMVGSFCCFALSLAAVWLDQTGHSVKGTLLIVLAIACAIIGKNGAKAKLRKGKNKGSRVEN